MAELRRMLHARAVGYLDADRLDFDWLAGEAEVDESGVMSWARLRPLSRTITLRAPGEAVAFVGAERVT